MTDLDAHSNRQLRRARDDYRTLGMHDKAAECDQELRSRGVWKP